MFSFPYVIIRSFQTKAIRHSNCSNSNGEPSPKERDGFPICGVNLRIEGPNSTTGTL